MTEPKVEESVPALMAPPRERDNPLTRSLAGVIGLVFLSSMILICLGSLPWTLGKVVGEDGTRTDIRQYQEGSTREARLPPFWVRSGDDNARRQNALVEPETLEQIAGENGLSFDEAIATIDGAVGRELRKLWPSRQHKLHYMLGTDKLGRSLLVRSLAGGGISIVIGLAAAFISVLIGTVYGTVSAYAGGKVDAVMMRVVDVLYGLPYILLVVLLAVAADAKVEDFNTNRVERVGAQREAWVAEQVAVLPVEHQRDEEKLGAIADEGLVMFGRGEMKASTRNIVDVLILLVAIGGVSWLTMARVVRGQVLTLKNQPFVEAARAMGAPVPRIFLRHLLPNLLGPIIVYATLTVPQAILQESFLSFLGIGVKPPLPSWGNLAADGLSELNLHQSNWWLLAFPTMLLGTTLLALNFVGEGLREAFDPKRARR